MNARYVQPTELTTNLSPETYPQITDRVQRMLIAVLVLSGTDPVGAFKLIAGGKS